MRNYFFLISVSIGCLLSCKSLLTKKYQFNRPFKFESKPAYLRYIQQHFGFDSLQLLTLKGDGRMIFLTDIIKQSIGDYYGCFLNDSTAVKKSNYLLEDPGCLGKITHEIEAIVNRRNWNDSLLYQRAYLKDLDLRYCHTGERFEVNKFGVNKNDKFGVLLAFHYSSMGTYFDKHIREILSYAKLHNDKIVVYIILFDEIFEFPLKQQDLSLKN